MNSKTFQPMNYLRVLDSPKFTIFSEKATSSVIYDPNNETDIKRLVKDTGILEFITDSNPRHPSAFVFKTKNYNMGVIANEDIKKNRVICEYLGEVASLDKETTPGRAKISLLKYKKINKNISADKLKKLVAEEIVRITHYAFGVKERSNVNDSILAHNIRSVAAFINHNGTDPNVKSEIIKNKIFYIAARNIRKGEQLTIDYGADYDYPENVYYIPSSENHLSPGEFFAEHFKYYNKQPIALTPSQKTALETDDDYLIIPAILHKLNRSRVIKNDIDQLNIRLPVYTFTQRIINEQHQEIYIPHMQQNYTALLYACTLNNKNLIENLIRDFKVDVFAKTSHDLDAFIVAIKSSETEKAFLTIATSLLKKITKNLERTDSIGSDHASKTGLHLLVDREWVKAIKLCDNSIFFDVIDGQGYDPLISAIAHGKTHSLAAMLKLTCVQKKLYEILFADDETKDDYVLIRALKETPSNKINECFNILMKAVLKRYTIKKKLMKFFSGII